MLAKIFGDGQRAHPHEGAGLDYEIGLEGDNQRFKEVEYFDFGTHRVVHLPQLGMRTFCCGWRVLGLQGFTRGADIGDDAVLLARPQEARDDDGYEDGSNNNRCQRAQLCKRKADELALGGPQKPGSKTNQPGDYKNLTGYDARRTLPLLGTSALLP